MSHEARNKSDITVTNDFKVDIARSLAGRDLLRDLWAADVHICPERIRYGHMWTCAAHKMLQLSHPFAFPQLDCRLPIVMAIADSKADLRAGLNIIVEFVRAKLDSLIILELPNGKVQNPESTATSTGI